MRRAARRAIGGLVSGSGRPITIVVKMAGPALAALAVGLLYSFADGGLGVGLLLLLAAGVAVVVLRS